MPPGQIASQQRAPSPPASHYAPCVHLFTRKPYAASHNVSSPRSAQQAIPCSTPTLLSIHASPTPPPVLIDVLRIVITLLDFTLHYSLVHASRRPNYPSSPSKATPGIIPDRRLAALHAAKSTVPSVQEHRGRGWDGASPSVRKQDGTVPSFSIRAGTDGNVSRAHMDNSPRPSSTDIHGLS
jgi:hypothetical protein